MVTHPEEFFTNSRIQPLGNWGFNTRVQSTQSNPNTYNLRFQDPNPNRQEDNKRSTNDYLKPVPLENYSSIAIPIDNGGNFELHPSLINLVISKQFGGDKFEYPHNHLKDFLMLCDTIQRNDLTQERIRLILFPFSLQECANTWLSSKQPGYFTT